MAGRNDHRDWSPGLSSFAFSMEKKESYSMKKHRVLFLGLALFAVMGVTANEARAELISVTVSIGGGPVLTTDALATVTATSYNINSPAGIAALNTFLSSNGSAYQFTNLGGASNFPGSTLGLLGLSGLAFTGGTLGTNTALTIHETESGFTAPTSPLGGVLGSSSSGTFTNQPAGSGQTASSSFNSTATPTYFVRSTGTGVNSGTTNGPASVGIGPPLPSLYTLDNTLTLGLAIGTTGVPVTDEFGVTAAVQVVPEPSTIVTMLTGLPLPLVMFALLRRRRAAA